MTARSGRGWRVSTEHDGRAGMKDLESAECQPAADGGREGGDEDPDPRPAPPAGAAKEAGDEDEESTHRAQEEISQGGQNCGASEIGQVPETHALEVSTFMSFLMMLMFVLATVWMSGQLPWRAYLIAGGVGYGFGFAAGFLAGRTDPMERGDRSGQVPFGVEFRMAIWAIMLGCMFHDFLESGAGPRTEWEPPLLWVPPLLLPAIIMGGTIDGLLLGGIAGSLPRRTPWHALRFVFLERRRLAVGRQKP